MKAMVYGGKAGDRQFKEYPKPVIKDVTDAIVRITKTTICGTDLHIVKGDVAYMGETVLGHEGIGIIEEVGSAVSNFKVGDKVLISCITSCGKCDYCKQGIYAHCQNGGGWILGHLIDGTMAEYVRIPFADGSLYPVPEGADEDALLMLSDILPTGYEIGVLKGQVQPGDTVAIVGAGPVGLAAMLTAQFFSPGEIIMVDMDENRLNFALANGATKAINNKNGDAVDQIMAYTGGKGVDVAIEAIGVPATFDICQKVVKAGGNVANVGVHGKPVNLELERLWIANVTITTGLVSTNTTPQLLKVVQSGKVDAPSLITHHFKFDDFDAGWEVFANAAREGARKVVFDVE